MKLFLSVFLLSILATTFASLQCSLPDPDIPSEWLDMQNKCVRAVRNQIQKEVNASFTYLAMAAHFSKDTINRPGFADLFFTASREERQHAKLLINYLTMRGELTDKITDLISMPVIEKYEWKNGAEALQDALKLEALVTSSIKDLISICESTPQMNDYHFVDYLTADFLGEQYHGQRDIAGKLSTLMKMSRNSGDIEEFLFDKNLLK